MKVTPEKEIQLSANEGECAAFFDALQRWAIAENALKKTRPAFGGAFVFITYKMDVPDEILTQAAGKKGAKYDGANAKGVVVYQAIAQVECEKKGKEEKYYLWIKQAALHSKSAKLSKDITIDVPPVSGHSPNMVDIKTGKAEKNVYPKKK